MKPAAPGICGQVGIRRVLHQILPIEFWPCPWRKILCMDIKTLFFVRPWPWWAGGAVIGLIAPTLYYLANAPLGVSSGYGALLRGLMPNVSPKWFKTTFKERWDWRVFFILGMVLGAFVAARLSGRPALTWSMGYLTTVAGLSSAQIGVMLFAGGFLLAVGARIAGGCTSGHSIHGLATLQVSSLITTVLFLILGAAAANIVRLTLMGGGAR